MRVSWREIGLVMAGAIWITLSGSPVLAASRMGGMTDDSVCDVGRTQVPVKPENIRAEDFIKTQCKNGQVLTGASTVAYGNAMPEIEYLAKRYCLMAEIQMWGSAEYFLGIRQEWVHARCVIAKLGKEDRQEGLSPASDRFRRSSVSGAAAP